MGALMAAIHEGITYGAVAAGSVIGFLFIFMFLFVAGYLIETISDLIRGKSGDTWKY